MNEHLGDKSNPIKLHIQLLGSFAVWVNRAMIPDLRWKSRRSSSLVKLLALAPGHRLHRDQVIDMLWPDSDLSAAANNLHQILYGARRVLGLPGRDCLRLEEGFLSLATHAAHALTVDVDLFEAAAAAAAGARDRMDPVVIQTALAFYPGDLLPDDPYEEWTIQRRGELRQAYLRLLFDLAFVQETSQNYPAGMESLQRVLSADKSNEEAHTLLMRLYALSGQRQQALRQYQALRDVLQTELEVEPSPQATRLYEEIQAGRFSQQMGATQISSKEGVSSNLPTGTVTFLFTDIEGSTPRWEQQPKAMQAAVARHHALLQDAINENGGVVFKVVGDQFQAAFRFAHKGVAAAVAAQKALQVEPWPESTGPLRVRMGLHTGPAELEGSDYAVSHTLNRAARVMSAGFGGQILLSRECADLAARELPEGIELEDLGEHRLKGFQILEHLYQVVAPGLPRDFPALPPSTRPHNLPAQLTSFIGREAEIQTLRQHIQSHRLVTLTGAGGTGKTRLALQVAERVLDNFSNGVFLVELAPLSDPDLVPQACLQSLELIQQSGMPPSSTLLRFLEKKHLLLILDNCEHVLAACTQLVDVLLKGCPGLHILATSREIISIPGESAFRVPSLAFPDPHALPDLEKLLRFEAIRLFVERAEEVSPGFRLTSENAAMVAEICLRLDGIPLAIELAAARARMLTAKQIASRLDNTFRLLTGGSKAALPRQQTLKATIDWSYDLLRPKERLLLQRLAVFSGGWTLEAAEAVYADEDGQESCAGEPLDRMEIMDLMAQLVDKSLVSAETQPNGSRYHMLETVRQYAGDRLMESGCSDMERDRHLAYFARLSGAAEPYMHTKSMLEWLERLDQELDNLWAALEWALSSRIELGLKIAADLMWFWTSRSLFEEEVERLEKLLAAEAQQRGNRPLHGQRALQRARALRVFAFNLNFTTHKLSSLQNQTAFNEESIAILRRLGPAARRELGISLFHRLQWVLNEPSPRREEMLEILEQEKNIFYLSEYFYYHGHSSNDAGRLEEAKDFYEKSLAICRETGNLDGIMSRSYELSFFEWYAGNHLRANTLLQEAIELSRKVKIRWFFAQLQLELANRALARGEYAQAAQLAAESLVNIRDMNYLLRLDTPLETLQIIEWSRGDFARSIQYGQERLELFSGVSSFFQVERDISVYLYLGRAAISQGDLSQAEKLLKKAGVSDLWNSPDFGWRLKVELLLAWIALLNQQGEHARAARLMGSVDSLYRQTELRYSPRERSEHAEALAAARATLGEEAFAAAFTTGQALTLNQALESVHVENEKKFL